MAHHKRTVISKISGGLGNQLFQYAAGRALAIASEAELLLDTSWYHQEGYTGIGRALALPSLQTRTVIADSQRVEHVFRPKLVWKASKTLFGRDIRLRKKVIDEGSGQFQPGRLPKRFETVLLRGLWQDERYFSDIKNTLKEELLPAEAMPNSLADLQQRIVETDSVGIHVRRGDYVSNPRLRQLYGVCDSDYYHRAADYVIRNSNAAHFFVFSDDPDWVRSELKLPGPTTVVSGRGDTQPESELHTMRACRHFILSNSTFGWWSAWLGESDRSVVCAPDPWFMSPQKTKPSIVPDRWVRIPQKRDQNTVG